MKKSWIVACSLIALALLLLPGSPVRSPGQENPKSITNSASKEQSLKLASLKQDMNATAMLTAAESCKDLRQVLHAAGLSAATASEAAESLLQQHGHIRYVQWMMDKQSLHKGTIPSADGKLAQQYVEEAAARTMQGEDYESPSFEALDGSSYMVVGVTGGDGRSGAVGVVNQDIVKSIERHQQLNLRLVPYPSEGNYRIESVLPNSTIDTTVRTGEDNGNASHYHVREAAVHFLSPPSSADLERMKREVQADSVERLGDTYVFRSQSMETEAMLQYFRQNWSIKYAEPHYLYMTNADNASSDIIVPNDALYSRYQWNLPGIATEKGWTMSRGDEAVVIAVLDTGVQSSHPDLQGRLVEGANMINSNAAPEDDVGHGTHVAGIVGASVNNGEGVAGVSWFNKMMPVKVLDSSGAGSTYSVAKGIIWAVDHGAKVINMSLGNYAQADFLHDAIKYAYERDVVLVAASGNDNTQRPGYPAAYPEVFAVAATNNSKQKASFSNYGDYIDVAAPGDSIASTYPGSQYAALSGTSMASPHVAALAGLIRSLNPELTNEQVMEIMRVSARDLGDSGKDIYFGYGEIDIERALNAAAAYGGALQTFPQQVRRKLEQLDRS